VRLLLCIVCFLLAVPQSIASREYRTSLLRQAATTLGIERQIAKVGKGTTTQVVTPSGTTVCVRIDSNGIVEHIGLPLFNDMMRKQTPSPVYDCLEYAALDRSAIHTENDLLLQKIKFYKGSWQTILNILPTDACSITNQSNKYYQLIWSRNGSETVNIVVPVDYELLSVCNRREIEKNFVHNIPRHHTTSKSALSNDIDPQLAKADLNLDISLSSYARKTVSVTLRQWISYCESQGCTTSIKYDDSDETVIKGYVLSRNDTMGYHHLLELTWTMEDLSQSSPKIKGKALLFIPNNDKL
jgi:hypothetical protein